MRSRAGAGRSSHQWRVAAGTAPHGRQRGATRRWFAGAAATFPTAYRQAIIRRGIDDSTSYGIRKRARLYEAATLFKIAARRAHRLNSPRPAELEAILGEIRACMHDAH